MYVLNVDIPGFALGYILHGLSAKGFYVASDDVSNLRGVSAEKLEDGELIFLCPDTDHRLAGTDEFDCSFHLTSFFSKSRHGSAINTMLIAPATIPAVILLLAFIFHVKIIDAIQVLSKLSRISFIETS